MSDLEIRPLDPLDPDQAELFERWVGVHAAADDAVWSGHGSPWSVDEVRELQRATAGRRTALAALDDSGSVVGAVQVLEPLRDHLDRAHVWLSVSPDRWRQGIGSMLLQAAEGLARAAGRMVISDQSHSPEESGGAGGLRQASRLLAGTDGPASGARPAERIGVEPAHGS